MRIWYIDFMKTTRTAGPPSTSVVVDSKPTTSGVSLLWELSSRFNC